MHKSALTAEEEAYQFIQQQIRLGQFEPGMRLVPETIASQIDTSRMPVRSALRRLAAEGLVEIRANRSAVVRGLNREDMREVFEMRAVLEGLAIRNAVANMGPQAMRRLRGMLDLLVEDDIDWTTAHREFHEYLCSFCNQPRLLGQIAELHTVVEPYMRLWSAQPEHGLRARASHDALIEVLRTGDPQACEQAMREHVMRTVPALLAFLR